MKIYSKKIKNPDKDEMYFTNLISRKMLNLSAMNLF